MKRSVTYKTFLVCAPLWFSMAALPLARAQATEADALVRQLGSVDPTLRQRAGERLAILGEPAREALVAAAASTDPEVRLRARQLLLALPWERPDDPPEVRKLLEGYGQRNLAGRQAVAVQLENLPRQRGIAALLRLLRDEPAARVRWQIVSQLYLHRDDPELAPLRQMPAPPDNAPLLVAKGWALLSHDRPAALALFTDAVSSEIDEPTADLGNLAVALRLLTRQALGQRDFDRAAQLLRRRIARAGADEDLALFELFALHAQHGPLAGYDADVAAYGTHLDEPLLLYAQGVMAQRQGQWLWSHLLLSRALLSGAADAPRRYRTGDALLDQGWVDPAERELDLVIRLAGGRDTVYAANACFRLSVLTERRGDDYGAAEHLQQALRMTERIGGGVVVGPHNGEANVEPNAARDLWARVHYLYFRAARARGDDTEAMLQLAKLLELKPSGTDVALDIVPVLKELGRHEDALAIFERAYALAQRQVTSRESHPEDLNNLAWLCARCDERLDEALAAAGQAVSLAPDNPAYLDTLAEVHFRRGDRDQAIALEERALRLQPGDTFMLEQLRRFRGP